MNSGGLPDQLVSTIQYNTISHWLGSNPYFFDCKCRDIISMDYRLHLLNDFITLLLSRGKQWFLVNNKWLECKWLKVCFCIVLKPQERKCLLCLSDKKGQSSFGKTWDLPICLLRIIDDRSVKQYSTKSGPVYLFIVLIVQTLLVISNSVSDTSTERCLLPNIGLSFIFSVLLLLLLSFRPTDP